MAENATIAAPVVEEKTEKKTRKHYGFQPVDYVNINRESSSWDEMMEKFNALARDKYQTITGDEKVEEATVRGNLNKLAKKGVVLRDLRPSGSKSFEELIDVEALNALANATKISEDQKLVIKTRERKPKDADGSEEASESKEGSTNAA